MENNLEGLFKWEQPKKGFRGLIDREFSTFWSDKWHLRNGFKWALWATCGLQILSTGITYLVKDNFPAFLGYTNAFFWFSLWAFMTELLDRQHKILKDIFKSWGESLNSWGKTAQLLMQSDAENKRLQERIDNMLGTDGK